MLAVVVQALLLAEPCYGFSLPEQVETEHVWLEYDDNISRATAEAAAEVAEEAYVDYVETFDWPPPPPFSILADFSLDGSFGRCITLECDDGSHLPQCQVYEPAFASGSYLNTTAHEVGHAFQYGITGPFGVSLSQWAWWMEGTAEYMAYRLLPVPGTIGVIETYLGNPQWRLHHTFSEFITGVPLPPKMIQATIDGECSIASRGMRRMTLACPDDVTYEVEQPDAVWVDFAGFPEVLSVRAVHRENDFGFPAEELIIRTTDGLLLLAYSDLDQPWEQLDPPWRTDLAPFDFSLAESTCQDEVSFPCLTCSSRELTVSDGETEQAVLHGDATEFGDWTVIAGALLDCETECTGDTVPPVFVLAIQHDSIAL